MGSLPDTATKFADQKTEKTLEDQPAIQPANQDVEQDVESQEQADGETESASLAKNQRGATMLEWTLLLAAIALPSYFIIKMVLSALVGQYRMMTTLNGLPFP